MKQRHFKYTKRKGDLFYFSKVSKLKRYQIVGITDIHVAYWTNMHGNFSY